MIKLKDLLNEQTVKLSTNTDADFVPGYFVLLMGKKGKVKLDKKSVHQLAKIIRTMGGKKGMGWSFTMESKLDEGSARLPNGVTVKIDFGGITLQGKGKPVFLDRNEMMRFFKATARYLK